MGRNYFATFRVARIWPLLFAWGMSAGALACDGSKCPANLWQLGTHVSGVPAPVIYGIAVSESGVGKGKDRKPHPWTLNSPAGPMYFSTRKAAEIALLELLRTYTNVDIGNMQVNWSANGRRFVDDPRDLLDQRTNMIVASLVLKDAVDASNGDLGLAVARYHSWKLTERAAKYSDSVFKNTAEVFQLQERRK